MEMTIGLLFQAYLNEISVVINFCSVMILMLSSTDIRFLASVIGDYKDYAEVGFEVACNGETLVTSCKYVYESVLADNQTVSAKQYGGDYFICYTAKELAVGEHTFEVRTWYINE